MIGCIFSSGNNLSSKKTNIQFMRKQFIFILAICLPGITNNYSCSKEKTGSCTLSCGGYGTGQPFTSTTYPFKTIEECEEMGRSRSDCKASYCPPTGNSNDCYQVYP